MELELIRKNNTDTQFIFELFCSHKIKELNGETWSEDMKQKICLMQFSAFESSVKENGQNINDLIITYKSEPIGRLILDDYNGIISIVYIGIISSLQNQGFGRTVINTLIIEAQENNKRLSLSVSVNNTAYYLYLKLGFVVSEKDELNYSMTYTP